MTKLERQQWMNEVWQALSVPWHGMFRAMHIGSVKRFRQSMNRMVETTNNYLTPPADVTTPAKTTCEYCRHAAAGGGRLRCDNEANRYRHNMSVGAGETCNRFERA